MNLDEILFEWSYRCPKGYPTIKDGKFVDRDEVAILNELLLENGFDSITLLEATPIKQPSVGNVTTLQEAMVCLFYDLQADGALAKRLDTLQEDSYNQQSQPNTKEIASVIKELTTLFNSSKSRYGSKSGDDGSKGSMPSDNLPLYIQWALTTKDSEGVKKVNNALSAAKTIYTKIGRGVIFRNEDFDAIRRIAVERAEDLGIKSLKADNWCPGDVYITSNLGNVDKALDAAFSGLQALNSKFTSKLKGDSIVACSLKEESAQSGKATEFANKLFVSAFDAKMSKEEIAATDEPSNKQMSDQLSAITRYRQYSPTFPEVVGKGKRKFKSYKSAVLDTSGKLESGINLILRSAGLPQWKSQEIILVNNDDSFYKKNKEWFDRIDKASNLLTSRYSSAETESALKTNFLQTRKKFIDGLRKYKVQVQAQDSARFYEDIKKQKTSTNILSKKIGVYNLALTILDKWVNREKANPAYSKLTKLTNPFAALTAFAVAESGINPGFWKIIGKNKGLDGTASWFDPKAKVAVISNKTTPIVLNDSEEAQGFDLVYVTTIGTHNYKTQLSFRYSDGQIRIEVQKLEKQ